MKADLVRKTLSEENARVMERQRHIARIRTELAKVDRNVTDQINILRNRIDSADRDYAVAKKAFDIAEKEYTRCKSNLERTRNMKELLARHLAQILIHNEQEKATRLEDLLSELNISHPKTPRPTTTSSSSTRNAKAQSSSATAAASHRPVKSTPRETLSEKEERANGGAAPPAAQPLRKQKAGPNAPASQAANAEIEEFARATTAPPAASRRARPRRKPSLRDLRLSSQAKKKEAEKKQSAAGAGTEKRAADGFAFEGWSSLGAMVLPGRESPSPVARTAGGGFAGFDDGADDDAELDDDS
uniref:RAB6-interacting golgin n=1 Tax=Lotharella globosa TaxID=91324 RepID=A0A7S3YA42_9EUKA